VAHAAERPTELKNLGYEPFIAGLSILSIVNVVLLAVFKDPSLDTVIGVIDAVMMPIFLAELKASIDRGEAAL
jgi:voltage-gated potassium channel